MNPRAIYHLLPGWGLKNPCKPWWYPEWVALHVTPELAASTATDSFSLSPSSATRASPAFPPSPPAPPRWLFAATACTRHSAGRGDPEERRPNGPLTAPVPAIVPPPGASVKEKPSSGTAPLALPLPLPAPHP